MNLNTMSEMYARQTNQALGFQLKSKATGRIWIATMKTGLGKYVIQDLNGEKEDLVDGDNDRYEFADPRFDANAGRRQELSQTFADLVNKEGELERQIANLSEDLTTVQNDIAEVEIELDSLN